MATANGLFVSKMCITIGSAGVDSDPNSPVFKGAVCFGVRGRKYYVPLLRKPAVKAFVIVAFAAWAAISAWQASKLRQDFDRRWFVNDDMTLQLPYAMEDTYCTSTGPPVVITTPSSWDFDYTAVTGQQVLLDVSSNATTNK